MPAPSRTLVMKFGGTSVGSADAIRQCLQIIRSARQEWPRLVVVTSALSGVTDGLLGAVRSAQSGELAALSEQVAGLRERHRTAISGLLPPGEARRQLLADTGALIDRVDNLCQAVAVLGEASPRARDAIASLGERMAARILSAALKENGIPSQPVDATRLLVTDASFGSAVPDLEASTLQVKQHLLPLLPGVTPVVTGFIGATPDGSTTTLGRGGSDYTAALLGVMLPSDEVWIWTDVDGVMTTDPRLVPEARTIAQLTFREISELAYFGAKVLHPKTIRPVIEAGITLRVLNTFNPAHPGTLILADANGQAAGRQGETNGQVIKAVTVIPDLRLITLEGRGMLGVPGVAARTFQSIAATGTSVPLISQASSEQSICFAVPSQAAGAVLEKLEQEFEREIRRRDIDSVWATGEVVIVSVVGSGMRHTPGVAGRVFSALGQERVNVIAIAQGSSEVSISLLIAAEDSGRAVRTLHALL